jgi:hypothetical protein
MYTIVANDIIYYFTSRQADMTSASHSKCLHNTHGGTHGDGEW